MIDLFATLELAAILLPTAKSNEAKPTAEDIARAMEMARNLAARHPAKSAFGLISRVALAVSAPGDGSAAREASEAIRSARAWPTIPGVPRLGFLAYPHFLLRASARLLAAHTEASLDAELRATGNALPTLAGTPPPEQGM
jgi:hypothetical protein